MSTTVTESPETEAKSAKPQATGLDDWVRFPATWEIYTKLLDARGERGQPRYTYLDGRMTIVSPGVPHEWYKMRLSHFIYEILAGLSIDFFPTGAVTLLKAVESQEGTEADTSYYLTNIDRIRGKRKLVMGLDPPPDLTVEVVISHPEDDALEAYRRFGVREVWFCTESDLEFLILGADGQYAVSPVSACFPPLAVAELAPWVFREDQESELHLIKLFRAWVEQTLAPRHRHAADA
jgi:Uma2 family endonuclease